MLRRFMNEARRTKGCSDTAESSYSLFLVFLPMLLNLRLEQCNARIEVWCAAVSAQQYGRCMLTDRRGGDLGVIEKLRDLIIHR